MGARVDDLYYYGSKSRIFFFFGGGGGGQGAKVMEFLTNDPNLKKVGGGGDGQTNRPKPI